MINHLIRAKQIATHQIYPRVFREIDYSKVDPGDLNKINKAVPVYAQALALSEADEMTPARRLSWDTRFTKLLEEAKERSRR